MELHAPCRLALDAISRVLHVGSGAYVPEGGRGLHNGVAVAHPHGGVVPDAVHQGVGVIVPHELGAAILASLGGGHTASVDMRQVLRPVAYTEQGIASPDAGEVDLKCLRVVDRIRASGENHSYDAFVVSGKLVVRADLAICVQLTHPAGYELRILGSEIQYDYFFLHNYYICFYFSFGI